jgi:hypothetical protein
MRAYVCVIDQQGLRWLLPEEFVPADAVLWYGRLQGLSRTTVTAGSR